MMDAIQNSNAWMIILAVKYLILLLTGLWILLFAFLSAKKKNRKPNLKVIILGAVFVVIAIIHANDTIVKGLGPLNRVDSCRASGSHWNYNSNECEHN